MKIDTFQCDICGIQKQPSNHWFRLFRNEDGLLVVPWESESIRVEVQNDHAHVCGHAHVVEWMSKEFFGKIGE